jgi:hypothetical protein
MVAPLINPLLTGTREAWRAIPAEVVAKAMLGAARRGAKASIATPMVPSGSSPTSNPCSRCRHNPRKSPSAESMPRHS